MVEVLIENIVQIVASLLMMLIGVLGTWLTAKLSKKHELANITEAISLLVDATKTTVMELQQTTVDGLKAGHDDGKLTRDEICDLNAKLLHMTREKMSDSVINLLNAAGVDINSYILGVGEEVIKNKNWLL